MEHKLKEKDFQRLFGHWIKDNPLDKSAVFELKIEKGKSFAFDKVNEHQINALLDAKYNGCYHKINDLPVYTGSYTRFANPKPFDCFFVKGIAAYVVIWFYKPRKKKVMLWIEIGKFVDLKGKAEMLDRKSLKEQEWIDEADKIVKFK